VSRGPGRIERAIRALFDANPDLAFVTDEVCEHCYPAVRPIERKHQVAVLRAVQKVLRAVQKVIEHDPDWRAWRIEGQGRGWVFLNHANVQSYALARLIGDQFNIYRSEKRARRAVGFDDFPLINGTRVKPGNDRIKEVIKGGLRYARVWGDYKHLNCERARLRQQLAEDDRYRQLMAPGGAWFRYVQEHIACRDDDEATRAAIAAQREADRAKWIEAGRAIGQALAARRAGKYFVAKNVAGSETLMPLAPIAAKARKLITENDPDAIRAGLAEIADALERLG
jgi:hypothetical protein